MASDNLCILSANVRGLRQVLKRTDLFDYFKSKKADILCLQETHLVTEDINTLIKDWNITYYLSGNSTNSRGVAILINNTFEHSIKNVIKDQEGRYLLIDIDIVNLFTITLVNIYAPNHDDSVWYNDLLALITKKRENSLIICGDWNTPLADIDAYNYTTLRHPINRKIINEFIMKENMVDVWRLSNKILRGFTWKSQNPCRRSRLDYFLISEDILSLDPKVEIIPAYKSDHTPILLSFIKSRQSRGRGLWKFNNQLLQNQDYIDMVKEEIFLAKCTYALPVYAPEHIKNNNGDNLELNISDTLFLDTLLCQLRGSTIDFSRKLKKNERLEECKLLKSISEIELLDTTTIEQEKTLSSNKLKLEDIRENRIKGSMIRSRAQLNKDWEKPSKYFLNLEKRNYINKCIPSLTINGKPTTDSKEILIEQHKFYSDLYSSKGTHHLFSHDFSKYLHNMPKLTEHNKETLDEPYTVIELEAVIKAGKLNKAPGPDGFSNEFFKVFLEELLFWIFRYFQECLLNNKFSPSIIEGTITCIPKGTKLRNNLKNWRPLTMLNSIYKFISSMIANRLKPQLPFLINEDQTGFIAGRFIGENTRTVYDIIEHCESFNVPGMILILDFAKAFDTLEWSFINRVFEFLNFGENFLRSINLLQHESFSRVEQNGFLSDKISLSRGCRQGDPISPYIFVLCAELLSHVLRECPEVRGIRVHNIEMLTSQYADDTTLFLDGELTSLNFTVQILKWFEKVSGLAINKDKTKVVKIGALRDRSIHWQGKYGFDWTDSFEILGISYNINDMENITKNNIYLKMGEVKSLIRVWQTRNLTPYGKITIIKSLLMSKFTHMLLSLPSPSLELYRELDQLFANFLWSGKPAKLRKEILEAEIKNGGLKLHNIQKFDSSLKLGWLKRFLKSNSKWTIFPKEFELEGVFCYGPDYIERIEGLNSNAFWQDVLTALKLLWKSNIFYDKSVIKETPLWFNPNLRLPIRRDWKEKGIMVTSDLLDYLTVPLPLETIKERFDIKINFLDYGKLVATLKKHFEWKEIPEHREPYPRNSFLNSILSIDTKGVANLYRCLQNQGCQILHEISVKWGEKTQTNFCSIDFSRSFTFHHSLFTDCYLKYTQFRTLHRRFYTNEKLHKMGIKTTSSCIFCKTHQDSVEHMLLYCPIITELWKKVCTWLIEVGLVDYNLTESKIILGDIENGVVPTTVILLTKKVIYNSFKKEKVPVLQQVQNETKNFYFQEKYDFYLKHKIHVFNKKWNLLNMYYKR